LCIAPPVRDDDYNYNMDGVTHVVLGTFRDKFVVVVDDDGSGTIEYEEFLKMMTHKILNRDPKDEILKAFRLFDDDETGKISFKNLKRVAKELGERMTDEELQEMIDEADRDGDGEVNEEEFLRIMKKTNLF